MFYFLVTSRQIYAYIENFVFGSNVIHISNLETLFWKVLSLSSPFPLLLNVLFILDILDSLSYNCMLPWTQAGFFQLCPLVHPLTHEFLPFTDLQSKRQITKNIFYFLLLFFPSKSPSFIFGQTYWFQTFMC